MHSFDVFDTLITRTTATPKGIFALMQEELLHNPIYQDIPDFIKENFFYLRVNAEDLARQYFRSSMTQEISLEQIYKAFAMNGTLSENHVQRLTELEKRIELNNTVGIQTNIERYKALINKGIEPILISDMYLDSQTIRSMLINADPVFKNVRLYVSSDVNRCKYGGSLYRYVKDCEKVEYYNWFHIGDNVNLDINEPKKLGIHTELFQHEGLTAYEKELIEGKEDNAFVQLTTGAARIARILNSQSDAAGIGCSIGGPILFPYVWWLLQLSIQKGIKRLYFIARDGYLLKKIADIIIKEEQYDIRTFYIYGSRRAWRMASISGRNNDITKFLTGAYLNNVRTLSDFADVFQLSVNEIEEFIPSLRKLRPEQMMTQLVKEFAVREILLNKDDFIIFLGNKHKEKRFLISSYIKQEVDYCDDNFAFVELAGSGLTQGCLAEIMQDFYRKPIQTFYFKLDCANVPNFCIFYDYIPSFMYLHIIIEILARAPHGQTVGYRERNGRIEPVLNEWEENAIIKHGFYDYERGVINFTENYLEALNNTHVKPDKLDIVMAYMKNITRTPDEKIMNFIGGMPNNVTGREAENIEYAPVLSGKDIRSIYLTRIDEPVETYYHGTAIEYSIMRSGRHAVKKIEFYKKNNDRVLGRLTRFPKRVTGYGGRKQYGKRFPYELLERDIIIYGAGKVGKVLYKGMKRNRSINIVQWIDTKYEEYQKSGLMVSSPEEIGKVPFDQVVIAVLSVEQSDIIRDTLIKKGVPRSKILWFNLRTR